MQLSINFMTPESKKFKYERSQGHLPLKQQIDELMKHDFQILRQAKNYTAQQMLLTKSNSILLEYVKSVYNQYNIADPLGQINLSYLSSEPSVVKTVKKKKLDLVSNHTLKYSASPKNISSIMEQNPFNNLDLDLSKSNLEQKTGLYNQISTFHQSLDRFARLGNQQNQSLINLRNIYKIEDINQQNTNKAPKQMSIQQQVKISLDQDESSKTKTFYIPRSPLVVRKKEAILPFQQSPQKVQQIFRYCVGCQKPIVQTNRLQHEITCTKFQQILEMNEEKVLQYICLKIVKMKERVYEATRDIFHEQVNQFKESSLSLGEQAKNALQTGVVAPKFQKEYVQAVAIGKKWCLISQQVNKIHWFLKIINQHKEARKYIE